MGMPSVPQDNAPFASGSTAPNPVEKYLEREGHGCSEEEERDGLQELRKFLAENGWYRKATGAVLRQLGCHLGLAVGGLVVLIIFDTRLWQATGFLVSLLGSLGVVTNTHTSSHYATSDKGWLNELLTYFGYPFFAQLSATYWWHKHCELHHPAPNVMGIDRDADLSPWFALTELEMNRFKGIKRSYHSKQFIFLPFALLLNGFTFQLSGWRFLIGKLSDRKQRKREHWIDLFALVLHWLVWIVLPAMVFALSDVILVYAMRIGFTGILMFCVLAPAHFPVEASCLDQRCLALNYALRQTSATVNFRTGWIGRLYCSGLDFQIEHHLFPKITHVYYPAISKYVKEFCEKAGCPYRTFGWGEALWKSYLVFVKPKPVLTSLAEME